MITATSTVNGFLTLNFSIFSYRFSAVRRAQQLRRFKGLNIHYNIPIIHAGTGVAIVLPCFFCKTLTFLRFLPRLPGFFSGYKTEFRQFPFWNTSQKRELLQSVKILPFLAPDPAGGTGIFLF